MSHTRTGMAVGGLLLGLALTASEVSGAEAPPQFEASYEVRNGGLTAGHVTVTLRRESDDGFVYRRESRPSGLLAWLQGSRVIEHSRLLWRDGALRPVEYHYDRTGFRDRHAEVHFDWAGAVAHNTLGEHTWTMPVPQETMDKLSVDLVMVRELEAGRSTFRVPVADGGHLKTYRFDVQEHGVEAEVPAGRFRTVVLKRMREADDPLATTFWLAPDLRYLPVKIERYDEERGRSEMVLARVDMHPHDQARPAHPIAIRR